MKLDERLIPQFFHSTVVVDTPTFGPIAFVLSGYGENNSPLSVAQMILIDFLNCKTVIEYCTVAISNSLYFDRCQYCMNSIHQGGNQSALLFQVVYCFFFDLE